MLRARDSTSLRLWPPGPCARSGLRRVVIGVECLVERCAGLDIGKADLKACVRVPGSRGGRRAQTKTFAAMTGARLGPRQWLAEQRVTVVAMEAPGTTGSRCITCRRTSSR